MEQYDDNIHTPQILPCKHTFCQGCLTSLSDASLSFSIECPVCKNNHNVPDTGFTTNLAVLDIMEELQNDSTSDVLRCKVHGNMESILVCLDCLTGLCIKCMKDIRSSPHKDHQLEEMNDAKSLLQQKFESQIKEKQPVLQQKLSKIDTQEIARAETDIRMMYNELNSILTTWRDAQLAEMTSLRDDSLRQKQEIQKQDAKLVSLLQPNMSMEALVSELAKQDFEKDQFQEDHESPNQQKVNFSERCEKLLQSIIVVVSSHNFREQQVMDMPPKREANGKAKSAKDPGASLLEHQQVSLKQNFIKVLTKCI